MHKMVFINLPVADLPRSKAFYQALGFEVVPEYTNDMAACIKISETIFAMLLVRPFFQTFTGKTIIDPATQVQVLSCLSCESRAEVDAIVAKALAAGGSAPQAPR
ncbi:MAG: glyoxalase/bleomycin resistance/extradiol dioxygenase family protein, partial [Burkholderia sp.]|nr:glyoxalase/bleomycin resistance/extradiol dioxygenase family protein [Burkholderia sp.]